MYRFVQAFLLLALSSSGKELSKGSTHRIVNVPLIDDSNSTFHFELYHEDVGNWREEVMSFSKKHTFDGALLLPYVEAQLAFYAYPDTIMRLAISTLQRTVRYRIVIDLY